MRAAAVHAARRFLIVACGTLSAVLLGLLTVLPAVAAVAPAPRAAQVPAVGGVDIDAVIDGLSSADVVVVGASDYRPEDFEEVVDTASGANIALHVVVLGDEPVDATVTDVANAVLAGVRGTVLVLSPTAVGIASDSAGSAAIDSAVAEANQYPGRVQAADAAVRSLTGEPFPWSLVAIGGVAILVVGGLVGGLWERRRRRQERGGPIDELGAGLSVELGRLRAGFVDLLGRARRTGRQDLTDRADTAVAECDQLTGELEEPTRRDIDHVGGELAELQQAHDLLDADLDAVDQDAAGLDAADEGVAAEDAAAQTARPGSQPRS